MAARFASLFPQRLQTALYYARKKRRARYEADPITPPAGRIMFGSTPLFQGNVALLSGTEDDVQLAEALSLMTGVVVVGGQVKLTGTLIVEGATDLQGAVKAANLATADGLAGVLYKDAGAANVVKVST